jgi:hypothetical protein
MKVKTLLAGGLISLASAAHADPAFFAGITYLFDGPERSALGFTVKALASQHRDRPTAAVGFSIYPGTVSRVGIDVGVGYQGGDTAGLVSYDLLLQRYSVSVGFADLDSN